MSEASDKSDFVTGLRTGLDDLHRYWSKPSEPHKSPLANVIALFEFIPAGLQANVLKKSVGKSIRRYRAAASLLAQCEQSDCIDHWIVSGLTHPDSVRRDWMIQIVGNRKLLRFSTYIVQIIETDDQCRWSAVIAAGKLLTDDCCTCLVTFAESFGEEGMPASLVIALSRFSSPAVIPHLDRVFRTQDVEERCQVFAAWGLGRQDNQDAIDYLVCKLDEPDNTSESRRAAQALSDLYGWVFEWTPHAAQKAKAHWEESQLSRDA